MLFHNVQMVIVITKNKISVVIGHATQCVSVVSCFPDLGSGRAIVAVAIAAAGAGIGVKVHMIRSAAIALHQDGTLNRESGAGNHCLDAVRSGRVYTLHPAGIETAIVSDIDTVADFCGCRS